MEERSILIIDDEQQLRNLLKRIISLEGYHVLEADNLRKAEALLDQQQVDIVLCDVKLPDGNGVDFTHAIKTKSPFTEIILLTAFGNIADGVQAMKNGAFDYLVKGNDNDKILPLLNRAMEKVLLERKVSRLEKEIGKKYSFNSIIGHSAAIQQAISLAKKVAPTDAGVLLQGETGTGKEVFAQAIHYESPRASKSFVALNCSAFPKEILESELFGHKAGAFTGAIKDKKGLIEEADKGTVFLDEISEMQTDLQAKLLRVLESGEFIKLGNTKTTKVDVRIIAASNRDLRKEIEEGKFRADLFYRLNGFTISLPALRERAEDIPELVDHFIPLFSQRTNKKIRSISKETLRILKHHEWKGNIRELKNVIERAVILAEGTEIGIEHLPLDLVSNAVHPASFDLATIEKNHIGKVLQHTKGNKTEAARLLNIGLTTLYRKIEEYHLQ